MSTYFHYPQKVSVPWPPTAIGWNDLDLAPYLINTDAKAVVMRFQHSPGGSNTGVKELNATIGWTPQVGPATYFTFVVSLTNGLVQFQRAVDDEDGHIWIIGEFGGEYVVFDPAPENKFYSELSEVNDWHDWQVTPLGSDTVDDIQAVILRGFSGQGATAGAKQRGSTDGTFIVAAHAGTQWHIIGLDAEGYYETYSNGKEWIGNISPYMAWQEIGYIKKDSMVVTLLNMEAIDPPDTGTSWSEANLSDYYAVPSDTESFGMFMRNAKSYNTQSDIYALTDARPSRKMIVARSTMTDVAGVALEDPDKAYGYMQRDAFIQMWLLWYEIKRPAEAGAGIRKLNDDEKLSGSLTVRENTSLSLRAEETPNASLSSRTTTKIRKLKSDNRVSANLRPS